MYYVCYVNPIDIFHEICCMNNEHRAAECDILVGTRIEKKVSILYSVSDLKYRYFNVSIFRYF